MAMDLEVLTLTLTLSLGMGEDGQEAKGYSPQQKFSHLPLFLICNNIIV